MDPNWKIFFFKNSNKNPIKSQFFFNIKMAQNFSEQEKTYLKSMFDQFDTNSNGKIDADELKKLLGLMGKNPQNEEEFNKLREEMDHNKDGEIEFDDFLANMWKQRQESPYN